MGLTSVAGVFSRYFIIGFFLPAFFILVVLAQVVSVAFLPHVYEHASAGVQIAIIGGAALLMGLMLLGLNYPILRLYEGYPLQAHGDDLPLRPLYRILRQRQLRRFQRMSKRCCDKRRTDADRFDARWRLDRRFPHDDPELILPTAFGNAVRAYERHSFTRWHLNGIAAWPHVENLLSTQEAQVLADARGDVAFFLNASLLTLLSGFVIIVDKLGHGPVLSSLVGLAPIALSGLFYVCATGAAVRTGEAFRAGVDLHRRELYNKLGLRTPHNFADERWIAWNVNNTLLIGEHLPDEFADIPASPSDHRGAIELKPSPPAKPTEGVPDDA